MHRMNLPSGRDAYANVSLAGGGQDTVGESALSRTTPSDALRAGVGATEGEVWYSYTVHLAIFFGSGEQLVVGGSNARLAKAGKTQEAT